eukprot:CAMPEP_0171460920 /NCGR_PEP_ID=MMETSP0945-20130129/5593_1 /TAXON_ID=109269 /ORGANISM="Vaucheria litorea, Strain CCMP2940" /LENGTH=1196 /DNA_ID=CAMNT_0011987199 /DNA_START=242 /DNA_END=3832 /DNA_ORIENTATION=+
MAKEGYEDIKRHRSDHMVNYKRKVSIVSTKTQGNFETVSWKNVRVGQILKVDNGEEVPADLVLLTSSEENGVAYIETSNIDGETNLKIRSSAPTKDSVPAGPMWKDENDLHQFPMSLEYEKPNPRIHFFTGTLKLGEGNNYRSVPIDQSNILLRGSTLKNTKWALGLVAYTGKETKIVKNARSAPSKRSNVDRVTNRIMGVIFAAMGITTTITLIGYAIFKALYQSDLYYICFDPNDSPDALLRESCIQETSGQDILLWFTFLILYNNFIPISLYVSLEMVNTIQAEFINQDIQMYDESQDTPALARTSNMNADLGQIEYVFSDKTGTLTQNVMKFKRCAVKNNIYGSIESSEKEKMTTQQLARVHDAPSLTELKGEINHLCSDISVYPRPAEIDFALCLALNHTVVYEKDHKTGKRTLQSESPDEEALVAGGSMLGIDFLDRNPGEVLIKIKGEEFRFQLLETIPFDSTRKRMSVLIRDPFGKVILYCKGADNIILDRSKSYCGTTAEELVKNLGVFAEDGLRTLLLARKVMSNDEYNEWNEKYKKASVSVENRAELRAEIVAKIECNLEVLGITAIEDKLQDDVPNTIADLGKAGVKLWVLTGDKEETAINIGYSCRLLEPHMTLIKLKEKNRDPQSVVNQLNGLIKHFSALAKDSSEFSAQWSDVQGRMNNVKEKRHFRGDKSSKVDVEEGLNQSGSLPEPLLDESIIERPANDSGEQATITADALALIVDGPCLVHILGQDSIQAKFLKIACMCRSVVACRVSPAQKRLIVRLVKKGVKPKPITLAIGDGANDVGMIQEAQVGVGISGKEGRQAVNNSDFAIAQFRFLRRLMLVHGHWDYRRLCKLILYSFYKNIALTFILFYYCFFTGFSGQSLYESLVYSGYNFFLALPILCVGLFDKDVDDRTAISIPRLYHLGQKNSDLNIHITCMWLIQAVLDSILIFFLPMAAYGGAESLFSSNGKQDGLYTFGTTVYTVLVVSMLFKVVTVSWTWNWIGCSSMAFSLLLYFGFIMAYSNFVSYAYDFYGVAFHFLANASFWLLVIQISLLVWAIDLLMQWLRSRYWTNISNHAVEFDKGYCGEAGLAILEAIKSCKTTDEVAAKMNHMKIGEVSPEEAIRVAKIESELQRVHISDDSIRRLNENLSPRTLKELGLEGGQPNIYRSSYAYDHVARNTGMDAEMGEEMLENEVEEVP